MIRQKFEISLIIRFENQWCSTHFFRRFYTGGGGARKKNRDFFRKLRIQTNFCVSEKCWLFTHPHSIFKILQTCHQKNALVHAVSIDPFTIDVLVLLHLSAQAEKILLCDFLSWLNLYMFHFNNDMLFIVANLMIMALNTNQFQKKSDAKVCLNFTRQIFGTHMLKMSSLIRKMFFCNIVHIKTKPTKIIFRLVYLCYFSLYIL